MAFVRVLLNVYLSLNQSLLTFWLYVRQIWITQLILAISLRQVIFLQSKRILLLICMLFQLCEGSSSFCTRLISGKLYKFVLCSWLALLNSEPYRVLIITLHFTNCKVNSYYCDRNVSHNMKNAKQFFRFKINLTKRYKEWMVFLL